VGCLLPRRCHAITVGQNHTLTAALIRHNVRNDSATFTFDQQRGYVAGADGLSTFRSPSRPRRTRAEVCDQRLTNDWGNQMRPGPGAELGYCLSSASRTSTATSSGSRSLTPGIDRTICRRGPCDGRAGGHAQDEAWSMSGGACRGSFELSDHWPCCRARVFVAKAPIY
jgi:hypothetical protein